MAPVLSTASAQMKRCAELVYANFGTIGDFELLAAKGISVKDKIVMSKYTKIFRGLRIRAVDKYGAAGVIIYSDPQEDGELTAKNRHLPYPHGLLGIRAVSSGGAWITSRLRQVTLRRLAILACLEKGRRGRILVGYS